jgi:hypothetical protein
MSVVNETEPRQFGEGTCPECRKCIVGRALPDGTVELAAHPKDGQSCPGMRRVVPDFLAERPLFHRRAVADSLRVLANELRDHGHEPIRRIGVLTALITLADEMDEQAYARPE